MSFDVHLDLAMRMCQQLLNLISSSTTPIPSLVLHG